MPRFLEFIISFVGLVLFSPLFFLIAVLIPLESKGPVFYKAHRTGRGGKTFFMWKFRSMVSDADIKGPAVTTRRDSRITAVGSFIRRTKLDELPQLINVLTGDMGFVGPRPEDPKIVRHYTESQKMIFRYRPGITSPASITFRAEEELIPAGEWEAVYLKEILPKKLEMDLLYMEKATMWSDIKIIFKTIFNK
jgi:lipopolysaccharide/colanic/teichoic acid biosynthesis glycosyltransferase